MKIAVQKHYLVGQILYSVDPAKKRRLNGIRIGFFIGAPKSRICCRLFNASPSWSDSSSHWLCPRLS